MNPTATTLTAIVAQIDSLIADQLPDEGSDISDFTAELYSSRLHAVRAIARIDQSRQPASKRRAMNIRAARDLKQEVSL